MNALDWDHNAYYHRLLLRHLPRPCGQVLDVGCGAGGFAVELARRAAHVDALDRSPAMIEKAKRVVPSNVTCILADVLQEPLPGTRYDAIVSISALHHAPVEEVLPRLARALRPGGVLAAAALPRFDLVHELPAELTAAIGYRMFGAAFATLRAVGGGRWYAKEKLVAGLAGRSADEVDEVLDRRKRAAACRRTIWRSGRPVRRKDYEHCVRQAARRGASCLPATSVT